MSLSTWENRVNNEYKKILKKRKDKIRDEWRENWNKHSKEQQEALKSEVKSSWRPTNNASSVAPKPPVHILPHVKPLPPMINWVLTPRNCIVKKENNSLNIPVPTEQKTNKADRTFVNDQLQGCGVNVHSKENDFSKVDGDLLLELVETLQLKYVRFSKRHLPPEPLIFEAMSATLFKHVTPTQLQEEYEKLTEAKDPNLSSSSSFEQALQTFKKYFCRRCFLYSCDLHRGYENSVIFSQVNLSANLQTKTPTEACGASCYKLLESAVDFQSSKENSEPRSTSCIDDQPSSSNFRSNMTNLKPKCGVVENVEVMATAWEWNDYEKSLYKVLYNIFPNNYCNIAQSMLTRTCRQVYEYAQIKNVTIVPMPKTPLKMSVSSQRRRTKGWSFFLSKKRELMDAHLTNTQRYSPCNHPVKSCNNDCSCVSKLNACEKYCSCSLSCRNRFQGCSCRGPCKSKKCPCFAASRECDPDLCISCGACEYDLRKVECRNILIQRGLRKHLLLAPSDVAGWGIFLKDDAQKDELISEYVGEIISQEEADRRGNVYDMKKSSYLFNLNKHFVVDATYWGSKIRFANHSINPNCYAKVLLVLGDHRIGIFAKNDISSGEELFLDYRYGTDQLKFVSIERKMGTS